MEYRTEYQGGKGEIVEKKSRFIAEVFLVHSEEEAMQYLEQIRKKYWDARHHCWAYVIGEERVTERCSDDGEPSGTAGKPILEVIRGAGLHNIFVVVTRYFGGTLLGTGGLVRADNVSFYRNGHFNLLTFFFHTECYDNFCFRSEIPFKFS